jgi:inner membrane protein
MDSLTQMALGAAVGTAVLGRRVGARAAVWGALCGTMPDLDVFITHGDPVRDFTFHRAASHALFYHSLVAPLIALVPARLHRARAVPYRGWVLLVWLALITHALLDACTIYGTQLLLPFSDHPVGLGSIFIIDPLYTLPLIAGVLVALGAARRLRWNTAGLALSTLYLAWSAAAQHWIEARVDRAIAGAGIRAERVLVTPTPFNTLLWRVVVIEARHFREGFVSVFDVAENVALSRYPRRVDLLQPIASDWNVQRLAWFAKGFYAAGVIDPGERVRSQSVSRLPLVAGIPAAVANRVDGANGRPLVIMTDLRMGQVPWFVFTFVVAQIAPARIEAVAPVKLPSERPDAGALTWIWQRIWDAGSGPPPGA